MLWTYDIQFSEFVNYALRRDAGNVQLVNYRGEWGGPGGGDYIEVKGPGGLRVAEVDAEIGESDPNAYKNLLAAFHRAINILSREHPFKKGTSTTVVFPWNPRADGWPPPEKVPGTPTEYRRVIPHPYKVTLTIAADNLVHPEYYVHPTSPSERDPARPKGGWYYGQREKLSSLQTIMDKHGKLKHAKQERPIEPAADIATSPELSRYLSSLATPFDDF